MMPQREVNEAIHQQADPDYGRYEGDQRSSAGQQYEISYEQDLREGSSGKVRPFPRDNANLLHFALAVISLGFLLLFGLIFVVIVGGTAGWISFAAACFAICCILAYSHATMPQKR